MALNPRQRGAIIEDIVANSPCWDEGDEETLNAFSDEKLVQIQEYTQEAARAYSVANAAAEGFDNGQGQAYRVNPKTGRWESRVTNEGGESNFVKKKPGKEEPDEEGAGFDYEGTRVDKGEMENNSRGGRRRMTQEEIMRSLPPEMQQMIANAQQIESQ